MKQLTKEQQELWRNEIKQAYYAGYEQCHKDYNKSLAETMEAIKTAQQLSIMDYNVLIEDTNNSNYKLLSSLDTLGVKEVDLEKEVEAYLNTFYLDKDLYKFAKHFFELGLKAQKGE